MASQQELSVRGRWGRVRLATCVGLLVAALAPSPVQAQGAASLRLVSVEPTVFFIREGAGLLQVAEVVVENTAGPVQASLEVRCGTASRSTELGEVKPGKATYRVHVPEVSQPEPMELRLAANGKLHDRLKMTWQPQRRWEVCLVPVAHHDLGYTDTLENVLRQYDGFYDDVLRFCDETADWPEESKYRYLVEGTWSLQHFVENRPQEVIEKLVKYIKEGRIEVPAFFGNEISGLCSHEGLIRLMYPSFRLKRLCGVPIRSASITDVPGLSWGVPTVLAGAGVKYFFAGLPTYFEWGRSDVHTFWDEAAILRHGRPDAFRWQGPDGESVLVYYQGGYGEYNPSSYRDAAKQLPGMLAAMQETGSPFSVARYGFGYNDNAPPDIRVSRIAREWNRRWAYPKLIVATQSMFFEKLEKQCRDVRVFRGELPDTDYVVGATSTAEQTAVNRLTHERLQAAEKFATVASLLVDFDSPVDEIRRAYDDVLLYDEHTWGMDCPVGRAQDWNWSDKSRYAYRAAGLAEAILYAGSLPAIAQAIGLDKAGRHLVVFNSLSFPRTDLVRVLGFTAEGHFDLVDEETGASVPYQIVELQSPRAPVPDAPHRYARGQFDPVDLFELVFLAEGVPPLGYKTYRIVPKEEGPRVNGGVVLGERTLENRFFKVALDPQTGAIESIYDKELAREILDPQARHRLNQLVVRQVQDGQQESPKEAVIRPGESGPVYGSLVVSAVGLGCPQVTQEIILYDKLKRIDLANRILKDSTSCLEIYFAFPFKMDNPSFRFEGTESVIEPLVDQFPGSNSNYYPVQHWASVSDGRTGVTLSPIESHLVEFGGLWPCYVSQAHHGVTPPDFGREFVKRSELTRGHMYSFVMDSNFRTNFQPVQQGDMLFRYSLSTHKGDWREGRARDFGWAVGNPLMAVGVEGKQRGALAKTMSFLELDKPNVLLLTLKRAEDADGVILRLLETEGQQTTATVRLPQLTIHKAYRTNLVEENQEELDCTPQAFSAALKPYGITTIRLQLSSGALARQQPQRRQHGGGPPSA